MDTILVSIFLNSFRFIYYSGDRERKVGFNMKTTDNKVPFKIDGRLITDGIKDKTVKQYLMLIKFNDDTLHWEMIQGQADCRAWLIDNIEYIDIYESKILVEDVTFIEMLPNVYEFLKIIENQGTYNDGFDINDYVTNKNSDIKEFNQTEITLLEDNTKENKVFTKERQNDLFGVQSIYEEV